jgi:signal transduction histidine kinase
VAEAIEQAYKDQRPFEFEHRIVQPDGSVRTLHARGEVELDQAGQVVAMRGTGQDVTDQKAVEAELRQLSAHLQSAREEERRRIAREIHDELGGSLTSQKMRLSSLRAHLGRHETQAALSAVDELLQVTDTTVQTVRRIATELRPAILDDFGLLAAMDWQLSEFARVSGLTCRLDHELDDLPLTPDRATAVFRVFQETLTNIARHAQATHVEVTVEALAGHLVLRIRDNGRGISQKETTGAKSLGLLGMRERVRLVSGSLEFQGIAGQGTTVEVRVPLQSPNEGNMVGDTSSSENSG